MHSIAPLAVVAIFGIPWVVLAADIEDCSHQDICDWSEVHVSGCKESDAYCKLPKEQSVSITINFSLRKRVLRATSVVHGIIAGIPMPFSLDRPDACHGCGISCPLSPGNHTYTYNLNVRKEYPKLKLKVKWELQNEAKKSFVCALIPSRIVEKKTKGSAQ